MSAIVYSEDELDALREIVNVAMGQAGDSLARLLDRFIQLPVPRVRMVSTSGVVGTMQDMVAEAGPFTAVRQAFYGRAFGEVLVVFNDRTLSEIAELFGQDGDDAEEPVLDVSNILVGACVEGMAAQLDTPVSYSPPSILVRRGTMGDVLGNKSAWQNALMVEVNFRIEGRPFLSHVFVLWPDAALLEIQGALGRFLEAL